MFKPFFGTMGRNDVSKFALGNLNTSCYSTSQAATILIQNGALWEAEMLGRSVFEGSCKFAYLCAGTSSERVAKANEYLYVVPELATMRRHRRIETLLALQEPDADESRLRPLRDLLIPDDEWALLRAKYSKADRQRIEQRWGLERLVRELAGGEVRGYEKLPMMLHGYGLSSHHIHQDGDATLLRWDRERRGTRRKEALEHAHAACMLSDLIHLSGFRLLAAYHADGLDAQAVHDFLSGHGDFLEDLSDAHDDWLRVEYGSKPPAS